MKKSLRKGPLKHYFCAFFMQAALLGTSGVPLTAVTSASAPAPQSTQSPATIGALEALFQELFAPRQALAKEANADPAHLAKLNKALDAILSSPSVTVDPATDAGAPFLIDPTATITLAGEDIAPPVKQLYIDVLHFQGLSTQANQYIQQMLEPSGIDFLKESNRVASEIKTKLTAMGADLNSPGQCPIKIGTYDSDGTMKTHYSRYMLSPLPDHSTSFF